MRLKKGLTLGKYSPLHKGHQLVIETALKEMDHLFVMIYDSPETTTIPLSVRANWIKSLYPQVSVIEAFDGPAEVGYTPEIMQLQENYILSHMKDKAITHFYSSEPYGEHVSIALKAENRIVDIDRSAVPVSGTEIRKNPFAARAYLSDIVYRDHIVNVVFLGAPSTGKSTIAEILAHDFNTEWMPEYGREYWEKNQIERRLTLEQLVEIAEGHLDREESRLLKAKKYLFTDTNVLTTRIFSHYYHGKASSKLEEMAQQHASRYDLFFLCDTDIPYDDTWDRSGDANRLKMQKMIIEDLETRKIKFIKLSGNLEKRVAKVKKILDSFEKYQQIDSNNKLKTINHYPK